MTFVPPALDHEGPGCARSGFVVVVVVGNDVVAAGIFALIGCHDRVRSVSIVL